MVGVVTISFFLHEAKFGNDVIYVEGFVVILEIVGIIVLLSKYFFVVMVMFCGCLVSVNNMIYLVILRGVLLVVFVTSILIRSLTNSFLPFLFPLVSIKGGMIFMIMIGVLTFL